MWRLAKELFEKSFSVSSQYLGINASLAEGIVVGFWDIIFLDK